MVGGRLNSFVTSGLDGNTFLISQVSTNRSMVTSNVGFGFDKWEVLSVRVSWPRKNSRQML